MSIVKCAGELVNVVAQKTDMGCRQSRLASRLALTARRVRGAASSGAGKADVDLADAKPGRWSGYVNHSTVRNERYRGDGRFYSTRVRRLATGRNGRTVVSLRASVATYELAIFR